MPDLVRLICRLAADPALSRGVRARLWILLAYLAMPFDLIPDFVPVVGYADDAILVSLVLRSVVRRGGRDTLKRNWPGTTEGLRAIQRLTGLVEPRLDAPPADTLAGTRSRLAEGDRQRCGVEAPS